MPLYVSEVDDLAGQIRRRVQSSRRPLLVALDGRSGVGKSTMARTLVEMLEAYVIEGDDFYAGLASALVV